MIDSVKKMKILVAIPSHNEQDSIMGVVQGVINETKKFDPTIVVFDDASNDGTQTLLKENDVTSLRIKKSFGLGHVFSQITKYFLEKGFDILVTLDGDGQFDPKDIKKILQPIIDGSTDMVTGSRFINGATTTNISRLKYLGNKLGAQYISSVLKHKYHDVTCGFRAYTKDAILRLHTFSDFTYTQEVFLNLGFKKIAIKEVPISTTYFKERKSKMVKSVFAYIVKSLKIILKSILIYSPMKLFGTLGIVSFLITLLSGVFIFFWDQSTGGVTPFKWVGVTAIASSIVGVILYSVGILLQITSRLQITTEEQLYLIKKNTYGR